MSQVKKIAAFGIVRDELPSISQEDGAGMQDNALEVKQNGSVGSTNCAHF
jgi:hypothetical protein